MQLGSSAEDVLDGDLVEDGPWVPLAYHVLVEFLAVEDLVDVPAEVVLDPNPRSDVYVGGLRVVLGDDQAACLHFRERS